MVTEQFDNGQVGPLVVAANIVGFPRRAGLDHPLDAPGMVLDVEPVPDIGAIPVHRQGPAIEDIGQAQGNQFFGKVEGAVVVGAVAGGDIQAVGVVVGPHQVIAARLAR